MRRFRLCTALFACALLLVGCVDRKNTEMPQTTAAAVPVIATLHVSATETTAAEQITVSPLAKEDLLLPLDSYSWEREYAPEYVVLHFTSAVVLAREDPYNMEAVRGIFEDGGVSIHYIVDRDGSIFCYIPEDRAAWHAGKGTFAEDARLTNNMNRYSIGIEMLAIGSAQDMAQYLTEEEYRALDAEWIGFTDAQYSAVKALVGDICLRNDIPPDASHIIGHSMYSPAKSDPGELFDWDRILD